MSNDDRIRAVLNETVPSIAMYYVACTLDEPAQQLADGIYQRLGQLDRADLARAVVLLIEDTEQPKQLASQILTGVRSVDAP